MELPSKNFPVLSAALSALCANALCSVISAVNAVAHAPSSHLHHLHTSFASFVRSTTSHTHPAAQKERQTCVTGSPTAHSTPAIRLTPVKNSPA